MNNLFIIIFLLSIICLIVGVIRPSYVIRWGNPEKRGRKKVLATYLSLIIISFIAIGMTTDTKKIATKEQQINQQQSPAQTTSTPAPPQQQPSATMKVTIPQFIEIYNKEIKQRHGDKSVININTEKPMRPGVTTYDIPDGKDSNVVINCDPTSGQITEVSFTVQGNSGEKFDRKSLRAWTAAVISATSPGISNDDIIEIRGKILDNTTVTKNGVFYMAQYAEKGSSFFQIIVRAK
ncbi:hypothetical protein Ga0466249_002828 [Sporomusaceae bacterium BoRhaA]|uniref:hypothetical protein n=1 Tax=Pelorhabdus rhamnosifermentans TaxID=2772457 RepID=UPI001C060D3F|nr:hypothetical protein [Pelorhabdus rhamnosifermentans]MBU2701709.1 hypothetical protein [Pelorhabdus rhamnosifermentans]